MKEQGIATFIIGDERILKNKFRRIA